MNREEYLSELYGRLRQRVSGKELESIMRYYEEYFDEAGGEQEATIIAELGTPESLAQQIWSGRIQTAQTSYRYEQPPTRRRWTGGKLALLICLFPIWLPLVIALMALAISLVLAFGVSGVACVGGGVVTLLGGFTALFTPGIPTVVFFCGLALMLAALGILLLVASIVLGKVLYKWIAMLMRWIFVGGRGGVAA